MTKKVKVKVVDYTEGLNQGKQEGYNKGIQDALTTVQSLLSYNGVNMDCNEFWIEYNNLLDEGVIK